MRDDETTDWGDEWVEPDVRKRFGVKRKRGPWIVVGAVVLLVILACLVYFIFRSL